MWSYGGQESEGDGRCAPKHPHRAGVGGRGARRGPRPRTPEKESGSVMPALADALMHSATAGPLVHQSLIDFNIAGLARNFWGLTIEGLTYGAIYALVAVG